MSPGRPGRRMARVNQLLREELSRLLREAVKDPRVASVTVTDVDCTPDLRHATVYVRSLLPDPPEEELLEGLRSSEGYLRGVLGRELHLRRIPEFRFEADRTLEKARRIEDLLARADTGPMEDPREGEEPAGAGRSKGKVRDDDGDAAG